MSIVSGLSRSECNLLYEQVLSDNDTTALRSLCMNDLFFLLVVGMKRRDADRQFIFDRCREVESAPDGYLDLWSREFYKSTIITSTLTIQDILKDPEIKIGIFSHTRPIAKAFLFSIKRELETNTFLKGLFPEILWDNPQKESPKWSLDDGIMVKRRSNAKECTVEAWGLVDGQPTSKHFNILLYDDMVTLGSVTTPEMIEKVTNCWSISLNLGADEEGKPCRKRYVGTRYHMSDPYRTVIERGAAIPRYYYPTTLGKDDIDVLGDIILLSKEELLKKRKQMGIHSYGCQMLQNPRADTSMGFNSQWINSYSVLRGYENWNFYLLVDPAGEKKSSSDYTVMVVIGMGPDKNYYLVDGIRDKINLTERTERLFQLVRKWNPKKVGYEKYGMQSDIEHIKYVQEQEGYRFHIEALGGGMPKNDRIRRLVPIFEQGRFFTPLRLVFNNTEGKIVDFMFEFISKEYLDFPVSSHDDCLKAGTLIKTSMGYKYIENIKEGDLVYTHKHRYCRVHKAIKKPFNGIFYNFRGSGQLNLEVSDNHKLYFVATSYKGYKETKCSKYGWIEAKNWKKKYRNVIPVETLSFDVNKYKMSELSKNAHSHNTDIYLDDEFSFILGYFIAEGHAHRSDKWGHKHIISFASHAREFEKRDRLKNYLNKLSIRYKEETDRNCGVIKFSSKILWEIFCKCYDSDKEKIIPELAYENNINLYALMDGWIYGDGWKLTTRSNYDQYCGSTSRRLVLAMRDIALSRGWYVMLQRMNRHRFGVKTKDFYQLSIVYNKKHLFERGKHSGNIRKVNNYEYASYLKKSDPYEYIGDVYDLQVEDDNSFIANGFIIHNCLDCISRICDPELAAAFPNIGKPVVSINHDANYDVLDRKPVGIIDAQPTIQGMGDWKQMMTIKK